MSSNSLQNWNLRWAENLSYWNWRFGFITIKLQNHPVWFISWYCLDIDVLAVSKIKVMASQPAIFGMWIIYKGRRYLAKFSVWIHRVSQKRRHDPQYIFFITKRHPSYCVCSVTPVKCCALTDILKMDLLVWFIKIDLQKDTVAMNSLVQVGWKLKIEIVGEEIAEIIWSSKWPRSQIFQESFSILEIYVVLGV